ncbi:beta-ketoacyl synthase N-terminal-like domain-containing protein [Falsiroseomonas ponticola]|uniref:beta-ketoacyl synthase N-terminal-like domain-containing protein n=1 Tax=Falsiroseomonas ponticola TaxID=2786951 RepID=UPI0019342411|nr:beta-ketoacyl synthase N-terminal-like domain-containing protein [Roseomonas ponticola]
MSGIAIIGMAGRFPGAPDLHALWSLLANGREGITRLDRATLLGEGVPAAAIDDPRYVPAAAVLNGIDRFDAGFWGMAPHEAALMDPQQRVLLETAWHALEDAHCDPRRTEGQVGVFVGSAISTYLLFRLRGQIEGPSRAGQLLAMAGNDKDYAATQLAYRLDLKGPAIAVQTACSSSLVAVHLACQSLLSGECDVAIAGGVSIRVPHRVGYRHEEGGMLSPDGHCRSFAEGAAGTVFGSGCGLVVLKRAEDAGRDRVRAIILGTAVNNDGSQKVGFAAPSQDRQAAVIAEAMGVAGITPAEIGHVEGHGTGTPLGDPIEVAALAAAFRGTAPGSVALGSLKSAIGHTETAAGVAGLIKTVLMLEQGVIAPTLHAAEPSRRIDWSQTPFRLATEARPWTERRIGGVSSFGIGGTNAHAVVAAAPARGAIARQARPRLVITAKDPAALAALRAAYATRLAEPGADFAAIAAAASRRPRLPLALVADSAAALATATPTSDLPPEAPPEPGLPADLPAYPFQRRRHWAATPRLGNPIALPSGETLRLATPEPWLRDHVVDGVALLPGAWHLALLAEAGAATLADLAFTAPLPLDAAGAIQLWQDQAGRFRVMAEAEGGWRQIAEAHAGAPAHPATAFDITPADMIEGEAWAETLAEAGLAFGPTFRRITHLGRSADGVVAEIAEDSEEVAILDAGLQALGAAVRDASLGFRPAAIARFALHAPVAACRRIVARLTEDGAETKTGDILWLDTAGAVLAEARGVACRRARGATSNLLFTLGWRPATDPALTAPHEALERFAQIFARDALAAVPNPARPALRALLAPHAAAADAGDAAAGCAALARQFPAQAAEIELVARCGAALPAVLAGQRDPLDLLFGDGRPDGAYRGSPLARHLNGVAAAIAKGARRVIEIGGGTGATTAALRAALPGARYLFTDIGTGFLDAAARRLGVETARLDIAADPAAQGIETGAHDLVVAANVLHATPDLRAAIRHAVALLAPGGRLLLVEGTGPLARLDITFGLTEGWTTRSDHELRPDHPLIPADRWCDLLREAGLDSPTVVAEAGGQVVITATRAALPWVTLAPGAALPATPIAGAIVEAPVAPEALVALADALAARSKSPRLLLATRGAEAVAPGEIPDPDAAALGGLLRTLAREYPGLAARAVDLDGTGDAAALAIEAALRDGEDRVAWRQGQRHLARLSRAYPAALPGPAILTPALHLAPRDPPRPGPGEVLVRVRAAGLNFKDALTAAGHVPAIGPGLGGEASGEVMALGEGVTGLREGDAVLAVAPGALATHLVADARLVLPLPRALSFTAAAALPIAGVTAWHALRHLAPLRPGMRVLVHAATGGVGSIALRLARAAGATIIATAGSEARRAALRAEGIAEVLDSRGAGLATTAPLDVVLGALPAALRDAALDRLRPGGTYIEIGRLGIASPAEIAARRPDIACHVVALDQVEAPVFAALLRELLAAVAADPSLLPPVTALPLSAAPAALQSMLRAEHRGKLVAIPDLPRAIRGDRSYLVTGAGGGLGLAIVAWLRARGAGGVLRVARRGDPAPDLVPGDVTDAAALAAVTARAASLGLPPIGGVIHAAGLLEDGLAARLPPGAFDRVAAPKRGGLTAILAEWPHLDLLIGFSSAGALFGSAGQAAHTAASAGLDAALREAAADGINAVAVDWGAWRGIGAAAERGVDVTAAGMGDFSAAEAFDSLDQILALSLPQAAVLPLREDALREAGAPPLLRDLLDTPVAPPPPAPEPSCPDMPPEDRRAWLRDRIAAECAGLLSLPGPIDPRRPLQEYGLDSLGSLELRNRLSRLAGAALPATLLFNHPSIAAIAEHLAVTHFGMAAEAAPAKPDAVETPDDLTQASDEELDAALAGFAALLGEEAR